MHAVASNASVTLLTSLHPISTELVCRPVQLNWDEMS